MAKTSVDPRPSVARSLCLFFLIWFLSEIGMMYWEFPNVSAARPPRPFLRARS